MSMGGELAYWSWLSNTS